MTILIYCGLLLLVFLLGVTLGSATKMAKPHRRKPRPQTRCLDDIEAHWGGRLN